MISNILESPFIWEKEGETDNQIDMFHYNNNFLRNGLYLTKTKYTCDKREIEKHAIFF